MKESVTVKDIVIENVTALTCANCRSIVQHLCNVYVFVQVLFLLVFGGQYHIHG